jgi:release factor glutamine methyltransferase
VAELALSVQDELATAAAQLRAGGITASRREALLLWSGLDGSAPGDVLVRDSLAGRGALVARFRQAVARRIAGEPIQYVVGSTGFRRLVLATDRRALIPRPETEGLIDLALGMASTGRALDLGTGTGCLALALADEGSYRDVTGIDASEDALALARENAVHCALDVRFLEGDWVAPVLAERFDVIVTNPPYIATRELAGLDASVTGWEPRSALDGGASGLEVPHLVLGQARAVAAPGAALVMELDATRASATADIARALGWTDVKVHDDLFGRPRYLTARQESPDAR